jgi:hypothetical protein
MKADRVLPHYIYEGVIKAFVKRAHISLRKSLDLFYKSELYTEISEGISDMHGRGISGLSKK